jgi:hypothetical protein
VCLLGANIAALKRVDWYISEPLVLEAAMLFDPSKVLPIIFRVEEVVIADLEAAEELAFVVFESCLWVKQPVKICLGMCEFGGMRW